MAGTKLGGKRAAATVMKTDPDFFKRIGAIGGRNGAGWEYQLGGTRASGFAHPNSDPVESGRKGGTISRRNGRGKRVETVAETVEINERKSIWAMLHKTTK